MSPNLDEVKEWLQIAWEDLITAKLILDHNQTILRIACFHCQQSIEKSLKAFLTWKGQHFEKTHNISYLLKLCNIYGLEFTFLKDKADIITSYAVEMRYSLVSSDITLKEAQEAFDVAEITYKFIKDLIKDVV